MHFRAFITQETKNERTLFSRTKSPNLFAEKGKPEEFGAILGKPVLLIGYYDNLLVSL